MPHAMTEATPALDRCIRDCLDCARSCYEMITHCLELGGEHAEPRHIKALLDCAQMCETSAAFMARGSELHPKVCGVCAEACERCAEECERFPDDEAMAACAAICRKAAESCRTMAGTAA